MRRLAPLSPLLLALVAPLPLLAGGCFYVDNVNARPVAKIDVPAPAVVHRGDTVHLNARKSHDDDGEPLKYTWRALVCRTPMDCDPPFATQVSMDVFQEFAVTIDTHDLVTVGLEVEDPHGAQDLDTITLTPVDRAPSLDLQSDGAPNRAGNFTIGRTLHFTAAATDPDMDPTTFSWALTPPPASRPDLVVWTAGPTDTSQILVPDAAGTWTVTVSADDGAGMVTPRSLTFVVDPDLPPCIGATDPAATPAARYVLSTSDLPRRFAVATVSDELDPFPIPAGSPTDVGGTQFSWFLSPAGAAPAAVAGHDVSSFDLDPALFAPGDLLDLRVQIADRVARTLPCDPDRATCSITGDACLQRVTWSVEIR